MQYDTTWLAKCRMTSGRTTYIIIVGKLSCSLCLQLVAIHGCYGKDFRILCFLNQLMYISQNARQMKSLELCLLRSTN
uniref:Uncharacterized protein n=1 Tax=Arundo donax TaxID=35708 RepID=A0A0A9FIA6_ARUDO